MRRKYHHIADAILADIRAGKYPERLPGVRVLAAAYGANFKTAARAVETLAAKGTVRTERGRGARVLSPTRPATAGEPESQRAPVVGLMIRHTGHYFSELAEHLTTQLRAAGLIPFCSDPGDPHDGEEQWRNVLEYARRFRPRALVLDLTSRFPLERLRTLRQELPRLILLHDSNGVELDADYVLTDAWLGGFLATRHLLELGHRRIAILAPEWRPPAEIYRFSSECAAMHGSRDAMEEFDALDQLRVVQQPTKDDDACRRQLRDLLAAPDRPTAIVARGDFRLVPVYDLAAELGLRIPGDLSLIGSMNTPWAERLALTSLSYRPEQIAGRVTERLLYNGPKRVRSLVRPTLVQRASCAPPTP